LAILPIQFKAGEDGKWAYQFDRFDRWLAWRLREGEGLKGSELLNILTDLGCFEKIDLYNLIAGACEETLKLNPLHPQKS
jgi:hypothetical protein